MNNPKLAGILAASMGFLAHSAFPQAWTNPYVSPTASGDCAGLPANLKTGFKVEPVISSGLFPDVAPYRVIKTAFYLQPGARNTDIYIAEKGTAVNKARVLRYDGVTGSLKAIGTLPNANYGGGGTEEQGLVGIALNPRTFAEDHFLYLFYSTGAGTIGSAVVGFRLSRVTLDAATHEMDFRTEKVLLHIPTPTSGSLFTGGAMNFDDAGNLYVSVGDNTTTATGPGNTADLRGSILRIRPDAANPRGYAIPAGNFGEYWAGQFDGQGRAGLAAKYRDTARVKAEIYIKGVRNVYSFGIDPARPGTVEWSQCGPDAQRGETHSVTTKPAFGGWPFWVHANGNAVRQAAKGSHYYAIGDPGTAEWAEFNPVEMSPSVPINHWPNIKGVDTLPPYHLPFHSYTSPSSAAGGPIVRYDGSIANPGKMPPHLDNTILFSDLTATNDSNSIWAITYDPAAGTTIGKPFRVFTMAQESGPRKRYSVDFHQGPDGALYMVDWGAGCCSASPLQAENGIVRISYAGTCQDTGLNPVSASPKAFRSSPVPWFRIGMGRIILSDDGSGLIRKGRHSVRIMDLNGKVLRAFAGGGSKEYPMPKLPSGQLYIVRAETPLGIAQKAFSAL